MKKHAYTGLFAVFLVVSFLAGGRYSQHAAAGKVDGPGKGRTVSCADSLHPSHTPDKPGTASCETAIEPVYASQAFMEKAPAGADRDTGRKADLCPVCSMVVPVPKARAAGRVSNISGKDFYFCSDICKQRFDKNPPQYQVDKKGGDPAAVRHAGSPGIVLDGGVGIRHD